MDPVIVLAVLLIVGGCVALKWMRASARLDAIIAEEPHRAGCDCWCCPVTVAIQLAEDPWSDPDALISAWLTTDARVLLAEMPEDPPPPPLPLPPPRPLPGPPTGPSIRPPVIPGAER